ncbi:protein kinase domain-containing protein [Nocardia miyunensis]|uniref:protein kinase domain-containing protein n=1 Tax=Nocardia miyunensis TaxID=282684 RepID=UPI0008335927|nr:protein kinase [Nocardia miyunensis]
MTDTDPFKTERDLGADVVTELSAVGFENADEIGRGGFAVVYRCNESVLDRVVAVKVLTRELDENRERFFREQRAMARLTGHPHIAEVLEVGETETGRPYLVMPYCSRGSLHARIIRDGPLSLQEVLRLGVKMAGALETAHRAEVLHRDVKPANILYTDYGEPALTDFGIAHLAGGFRTATGTVTGSPAFTAPEVLRGDPASFASDVYGLGATVFCALTGHAAFERRSGEQVVAQFLRIATQSVPDLRERGIPDDVCAIVEAAMNSDAQDRPSAALFGELLQRAQLAHGFGVDQMALPVEPSGEPVVPVVVSERWDGVPDRRSGLFREGVGNLPLELTHFVDRRRQVSEVKNLLSSSCLVTLTGIGGVGKSRLALRVAQKSQPNFADGVWLVELSELLDPSLVADVVAGTFGVRHQVGRPMLEVLVEFFTTRDVLLVLDNCEQVIDGVAKLVESLLRACPQLRILATSREALGIGGESVLPVPPLGFPDPRTGSSLRGTTGSDAVTLFAERAAAAVPGFQLTEDNRLSVAGICARLDGLPLAIELAAARLRTMSVEQILVRLNDRFALLTRGSRSAPTRQQTLGWCIGWSYDLCTPEEQRLWCRLSVFAGSFELDAAEDVCGSDMSEPEFLDALSALVDKSILIREETGSVVRFRLLETVQEYGLQKITDAGEYAELRRHHRDWYERLVLEAETDWVSPRQLEWIARLTRELPNLRKALELSRSEADAAGLRTAAALFGFWLSSGRLSEGRRWCDRTLTSTSDAPAVDRAGALYTAAVFAVILGDLLGANGHVAELRVLAEQTADHSIGALLAYADGYTALSSGDLACAATRLNEAVTAFDAHSGISFQLKLRALISLGWRYELAGDLPRALACLEQVLTVTERHGETVYRSLTLRAMALAVWQSGERERAAQLLEQAIRLARQIVDPLVAAYCSEILAWIAAEKHDARRAAVLLGAAHGLGQAVGGSSIRRPHLLVFHEECERRTRDVLGRRKYESAYQKGVAMSFDAAIDFALREHSAAASAGRVSTDLTKRERQVVDLIAEGLTNKAIAARLVISQRTAEGHVEHILTKLGFTSRAQIATWAAEHSPDQPA